VHGPEKGFGGRAGLIDAVIEKLVAAEMHAIMDKALQVSDSWPRSPRPPST